MKAILQKLKAEAPVDAEILREGFEALLLPETTEGEIADFLLALTARGLDADMLTEAARVMRNHMVTVDVGELSAVDTCGTGGDRKGSFNFSTAAGIVLAACGIPVAKHGNRAITSKSGSADFLEALGIPIDLGPEEVAVRIREKKFGFMLAPRFHPATARVQQVRRRLDEITVFNFLGPLLNPAQVRRQVVGVFSPGVCAILAEAFRRLGAEKVWVVHSEDGLDELSPSAGTFVSEVTPAGVSERNVTPESAGLRRTAAQYLKGGDAAFNAKLFRGILERTFFGPIEDGVILNAAAGLVVSGEAPDLRAAVRKVKDVLQSGEALAKLEELKER
jgi:anthranilate phosphoribosyltransferase